MAGKSSEVRESFKASLSGALAGWLMRLWCLTLRFELVDRAGLAERPRAAGPVIYSLWHNRICGGPAAWKRRYGRTRSRGVRTSASHDGAMLARAVGVFGIGAVRGSSSRRGVAALVALRKALRDGRDACVTPDGPRGPRYVFQPGIVKLAETTGAPVVPIHAEFSSVWRLKTWDRFHVPKPGSRVRVIFDRALEIPPGLSEADFAEHRRRLERVMIAGVQDYDDNHEQTN
jgi:lysophospholipid acyltransferase (LPLAT)-like uncharacterized protein